MRFPIIKLIRHERIPLLVLGVCVWAGIFALRSVAQPHMERAARVRKTITEYDSVLAESGEYAVLRERLKEINDSLRVIRDGVSGGMPRSSDVSGILEMLIARARAADIGFVSIKPQQDSRKDAPAEYPVLLEFSSTYAALGKFIAGLESQPHIARIERLGVSARSSRVVEVRMLVAMSLEQSEGR